MLFIKSFVMGLSIAVPVGPIGMLCIQRSLSRGFHTGFATGDHLHFEVRVHGGTTEPLSWL